MRFESCDSKVTLSIDRVRSDGDSESMFRDSTLLRFGSFFGFSLPNFWRFQAGDSGNRAIRDSVPLRFTYFLHRQCKKSGAEQVNISPVLHLGRELNEELSEEMGYSTRNPKRAQGNPLRTKNRKGWGMRAEPPHLLP